jgi:hypothetical protein
MVHDPFGFAWTCSGLALGVAWVALHIKGKELTARIGISETAALYALAALSLGWLLVGAIGSAVGL